MTTTFEWNDKKFNLRSKYAPSRLFWGTENTLSIDNNPSLVAKGSGLTADDETTITDQEGNAFHIHLNVHSKISSMGYAVRVNGELISSGIVVPENGLLAFPVLFLQCATVFYLTTRLF